VTSVFFLLNCVGHTRLALPVGSYVTSCIVSFCFFAHCIDSKSLLFVCQEIPKAMPYTKGAQIEVSKLKDDSVIAWLPAVVAKTIWKNNLVVEYTVSKRDDTALSEEIVDAKHVRPCPPHASTISFCINDEVEAFQADGWWLGVITEVHQGQIYTFKSAHSGDEVQLDQKLLRLQYDWVDGQWKQESQVHIFFEYLH
jgi:hypothetical protein